MTTAATLLICLIVGVSDGDSMTARCDGETLKIRLAEIDAPEKAQAFGSRSKEHLAGLCFQRSAEVRPQTKDRYGRTVARVSCSGVDANAGQVVAGMAWVFDRYVADRALYEVQDEARTAGRGLWADPAPTPPWEWRRRPGTTVGTPPWPPR